MKSIFKILYLGIFFVAVSGCGTTQQINTNTAEATTATNPLDTNMNEVRGTLDNVNTQTEVTNQVIETNQQVE